jgi:hypothetical protein
MKTSSLLLFAILAAAFAALFSAACASRGDDDDSPAADLAAESVWTDPASGLTWQNGAPVGGDSLLPVEANTYCTGLMWDGLGGWRMPTISELRSLLRGCAATVTGGSCGVTDTCLSPSTCWLDACNGCSASGGPGTNGAYWPPEILGSLALGGGYWSSSAAAGSAAPNGWSIDFATGAVYSDAVFAFVRCVR